MTKEFLENIKKDYREHHLKWGQNALSDFKKRTNWLKFRLPPHLVENKNAIVVAYWHVFDNADSREKIIEATPVETILRNLRV